MKNFCLYAANEVSNSFGRKVNKRGLITFFLSPYCFAHVALEAPPQLRRTEPTQFGDRARERTCVDDGTVIQLFVLIGCPGCISAKLKERWCEAWTRNAPLYAANGAS